MQTVKSLHSSVQHSKSHSISQLVEQEAHITLPKVRCAFHPNEYITNFCTCQSCLLPLCPGCVKIHTIEHINVKKTNPEYEPITQLLEQVYGEVDHMFEKSNENYKKIVQIDTRIQSFRNSIQQKIASVKQNILNQVQKYFSKVDQDLQTKIDNMNYVQMLAQYKDQTKKTMLALKNIQKCFNPENQKIMRVIIKYKGGEVKKQVQEYQRGFEQFLKQINNNFVTFSVREDYKQVVNAYLESIKKVQISDIQTFSTVKNISSKVRQVYQKSTQQNKKEIIKSIGSILTNSSVKKQNQQPENTSMYMSKQVSCSKNEERRRSNSKGKGLSLINITNSLFASQSNVRGPRAVNICQPMQFQKTTIVRKQR